MSNSLEYQTWQAMKQRCNSDPYYVKKGITICEEWINSFSQFYVDMGDRPTPNHTIDRINNDLGYSPDNCQWATQKEQQNNRTTNRNITHNGITQTAKQWAEKYNLHKQTFYHRIDIGWDIERALNTPPVEHKVIQTHTIEGNTKTIKEWLVEYNRARRTFLYRVQKGWDITDAIITPSRQKTR